MMNELTAKSAALTKSDRFKERGLKLAAWMAVPVVTLPAPILFFVYSFFSSDAAVYVLLALVSLGIGFVASLIVLIAILLWRQSWLKKLRVRLAQDGITVDELPYFSHELKTAERKMLASMSDSDPLLADAYRETLAMRLTATHVLARAKKDSLATNRQLNRLQNIRQANTAELAAQLKADREKFERIHATALRHRDEAILRLQTIEAAAARGASWTETNPALSRLTAAGEHIPLALELAKLEDEARLEIESGVPETQPKVLQTSGE